MNGDWVTEYKQIGNIFVKALECICGEPEVISDRKASARTDMLSYVNQFVTPKDRARYDAPLSKNELRSALAALPNGKAPGRDGLPKEFYVQN